jgi:hypothetical protein
MPTKLITPGKPPIAYVIFPKKSKTSDNELVKSIKNLSLIKLE